MFVRKQPRNEVEIEKAPAPEVVSEALKTISEKKSEVILETQKEEIPTEAAKASEKTPAKKEKVKKESLKAERPSSDSEDILALKKELDRVKAELALSQVTGDYSANEKKIISAIRSEVLNQNIETPVITRSMIIKTYRVSSRFIDPSIKSLIARGDIERKEKAYTSNIKTYCYLMV